MRPLFAADVEAAVHDLLDGEFEAFATATANARDQAQSGGIRRVFDALAAAAGDERRQRAEAVKYWERNLGTD